MGSETLQLVVQGGALVVLALVLWIGGKAFQNVIAGLLRGHVDALKKVTDALDRLVDAVNKLSLRQEQLFADLKDEVQAQATKSRHDQRNSMNVILGKKTLEDGGE